MIVVSRAAITTFICNISVTIGKRNISAKVLYLGLIADLTVDKGLLLPFLPIPSSSSNLYKIGDTVEIYGMNDEFQLVQRPTEISIILGIDLPEPATPSWRIINTEGYALRDSPRTLGGVLIDPTDSSIMAIQISLPE